MRVRTKWTSLVAVCRECDGGKRFAKELRRSLKDAGTREIRVVSSSCLDVCPKRGVTVAAMRGGTIETSVVDGKLEGSDAFAAVFPQGTG